MVLPTLKQLILLFGGYNSYLLYALYKQKQMVIKAHSLRALLHHPPGATATLSSSLTLSSSPPTNTPPPPHLPPPPTPPPPPVCSTVCFACYTHMVVTCTLSFRALCIACIHDSICSAGEVHYSLQLDERHDVGLGL